MLFNCVACSHGINCIYKRTADSILNEGHDETDTYLVVNQSCIDQSETGQSKFSIAGKNPIVLILIPCKKVVHFYSQSRYHKFSDLLIVKQCFSAMSVIYINGDSQCPRY